MDKLGVYLVPAVFLIILIFGALRRVPMFDAFTDGAKEGLRSAAAILPTLIGLMLAVTMLKASGALDMLSAFLAPLVSLLGIPPEVLPLALIKPVSGSGSTAVLAQLFEAYGADSTIGRVASVIAASSETTFYCIAVYYGAVGIKKTRHTVPAALAADITACLLSALAVHLVFYGV